MSRVSVTVGPAPAPEPVEVPAPPKPATVKKTAAPKSGDAAKQEVTNV